MEVATSVEPVLGSSARRAGARHKERLLASVVNAAGAAVAVARIAPVLHALYGGMVRRLHGSEETAGGGARLTVAAAKAAAAAVVPIVNGPEADRQVIRPAAKVVPGAQVGSLA